VKGRAPIRIKVRLGIAVIVLPAIIKLLDNY
jgi:hypothetical protein